MIPRPPGCGKDASWPPEAREGAPDDSGIAEARHRVFSARADAATSTMARGIFRWAAREAQGDPRGRADGPAG